jgi:hypothetical protein
MTRNNDSFTPELGSRTDAPGDAGRSIAFLWRAHGLGAIAIVRRPARVTLLRSFETRGSHNRADSRELGIPRPFVVGTHHRQDTS